MKFLLEYIDQIVLILAGIFIALNPSTFVRGFGKGALKTQKLVRIMGIALTVILIVSILYSVSKK